MTKGNSTTNAILVIILVLIVGFGVWYVMDMKNKEEAGDQSGLQINLGGGAQE